MTVDTEARLTQMQEVIALTSGKEDPVSLWARRGVKSEASTGISYLRRRVKALWPDRRGPAGVDIVRAISIIRRLNKILDT